jgi:hypothetical protein
MTNLDYNGQIIEQRISDNYVNLSQMAKANNVLVGDFNATEFAKNYLKALRESIYGESPLLVTQGFGAEKATWGHPLVAIAFGQWISPEFHVWCNMNIHTLMTEGTVSLKPMSPAEMFIYSAQKMLELEQKQAELEAKMEIQQMAIEANQMETEANTAEIERFRNGHGYYFSIAAYCALKGLKKDLSWMNLQGRKASALCRTRKISPQPITDPRFGKVNTYPDSVLEELVW